MKWLRFTTFGEFRLYLFILNQAHPSSAFRLEVINISSYESAFFSLLFQGKKPNNEDTKPINWVEKQIFQNPSLSISWIKSIYMGFYGKKCILTLTRNEDYANLSHCQIFIKLQSTLSYGIKFYTELFVIISI